MMKSKQRSFKKERKDSQAKKEPASPIRTKQARHYQSGFSVQGLCRKFVIQIPFKQYDVGTQTTPFDEKAFQNKLAKLDYQYFIQSSVQSDYVIRNITRTFQNHQSTVYQEYFDGVLSQIPLNLLNVTKRFKIFYCVTKGLKNLKDKLICHRAINPNNICLIKLENDEYIAKINYFEQAVILQGKKAQINKPSSKTPYSAPQVKQGNAHDISSDIWSLGLLLNYLLYGTKQNVWQEENQIKIQVPPKTPNWLLELLMSMLHYNPSKRPTIEAVLQILNSSLKCLGVLQKIIPIGNNDLEFKGKQSHLSQI